MSTESAIEHGEYVFATKYSDGHAGDPWGAGFYKGQDGRRHLITHSDGSLIRPGGYGKVSPITHAQGKSILESGDDLERYFPEVSMWAVLDAIRKEPGADVMTLAKAIADQESGE